MTCAAGEYSRDFLSGAGAVVFFLAFLMSFSGYIHKTQINCAILKRSA
jgi:hypothetical protein